MKICAVCSSCFEDSAVLCFYADHGELKEGSHAVDIIPGYRIESVIASSSKAVVYHARHLEFGQSCVISVAEADTAQFFADAKIAASLFHAGVAGVVESGELQNGSAFAVFEGFAGESLREVLSGGTLTLLDQIRIARQAAEAVQAIHTAGLVHGALRPESVSISRLGTDELSVKVHNIDLGSTFANGILANRFSMDSSLHLLKYFAPERFRGEPATAQSDVYSLGTLLYELLAGHAPFEAGSAAALAEMHLDQKPPEIRIENFDLRMLLTHTISESLQKQPSFRQSTADLFARQMRHIEQLATHVSTPPPAVAIAMAALSADRRTVPRPIPHKTEPIGIASREEILTASHDAEPIPVEPEPALAAPIVGPERSPTVHPIRIETPVPFVLTPKPSRLKSMKKRVHSYASDAKAALNSTPTLIDWQQPEQDVPSIEAVREELASSGGVPAFEADEEVLEVRSTSEPIGVRWSQPAASRHSNFISEFITTPTAVPRLNSDDSAVFGYQLHGHDVGKLPIYGVALFALLIVGFGVVQLGTALADDSGGYIGEARPSRIEIPAGPLKTEAVEPQAAVLNIPAQPIIVPAPVETSFEEPSIVKEKAVVSTDTATSKPSKRSPSNELRTAEPSIRPSSDGKDTFVPSTLVITRGSGKPKSVVVTKYSARESRAAKIGSGATRPRIVSLPD